MLYYSTLYSLRSYIPSTALASLVQLVPHSDVKWDSTYYLITLNILPHAGIQGGSRESKVAPMRVGLDILPFLLIAILYTIHILYYILYSLLSILQKDSIQEYQVCLIPFTPRVSLGQRSRGRSRNISWGRIYQRHYGASQGHCWWGWRTMGHIPYHGMRDKQHLLRVIEPNTPSLHPTTLPCFKFYSNKLSHFTTTPLHLQTTASPITSPSDRPILHLLIYHMELNLKLTFLVSKPAF